MHQGNRLLLDQVVYYKEWCMLSLYVDEIRQVFGGLVGGFHTNVFTAFTQFLLDSLALCLSTKA